ncbi:MAG: hypothetical protein KF887_03905 [Paracoccaceae bacterium]|nr:MAG: hypothetical protein KF887_03905 [Paracoccaceae bacterium]
MVRQAWTAGAAAACLALATGGPVAAGGTLEGRIVTLYVLTYDDREAPILNSRGRTVVVDDGIEFGLGPEFRTPGFDIVPVEVQIDPTRIRFAYPEGASGNFYVARFNGYVLRFETECALFNHVAVDRDATTLPMTEADIFTEKGELFINVAGRDYAPGETLVLDLDIADCPLS